MKFNCKMIIAGSIVEVYLYENKIYTGKDRTTFVRSFGKKECEESERKMRDEKNLKDSLRRTQNTLRRTVNSNVGKWGEKEKFLTLTFAEHLTDQSETNKLFTSFVKKLSYSIFKTRSALKYVCVVERMANGRIHYHVLFFNLPYVPAEKLAEIWGHGFVKINAIDNVDNVGAYVVKYMSKTAVENSEKSAKEKDKKLYFVSRGLHKPKEYANGTKKDDQNIASFMYEMDNFKVFESSFENEHLGHITYKQYNMNRKQ